MASVTKEQLKAAFEVTTAVCGVIRAVGEIPSGHLYARMLEGCPLLTSDDYGRVLETIKRAGLIEVRNNLIKWVGP